MPEVTGNQQPAMWADAELPQREPTAGPMATDMERETRLKLVNRNQLLLRSVDVDKLVEPDHLVAFIWELTERLDLRSLIVEAGSVEEAAGRPTFDPRLLISLWVFGLQQGSKFGSRGGAMLCVPPHVSVADRV